MRTLRISLVALRAQFLIQCLADLKRNLVKRDLNLFIQLGKPEDVLPALAKAYGVHTVKKLYFILSVTSIGRMIVIGFES